MNLEELIQQISEKSGLDKEKIKRLIEEKQDELSGLISPEGAAHIVARELGVDLLKAIKRELKVNRLLSGLKNVEMVLKILRIDEPREYEKDGKKLRVKQVWLGDETGIVRLVLWNDEIDRFDSFGLEEGMFIRIKGFSTVESRGAVELRLGKGRIEEADVVLKDVKTLAQAERKSIDELKDGDLVEVRASLVQVFKRDDPFYEVCPECGGKLREENGKKICDSHGEVDPKKHMVVSGVLDDGHGNIRAVFFREAAEKLLGMGPEEFGKADQEKALEDLLLKELVIKGRVRKNNLTGNLELIVSDVAKMDAKREAERILE
ncbi:MAG: hypothetical protein DRP12_03115 [Candidatus Aenigmatarchaeota archaeon]|nr:MAG: hypothetical protein DRP12_03115 [Candidatus Aenigmarchaeota archaeon]